MRQTRRHQNVRVLCIAFALTAAAACGSGAPSPSSSPLATSFDEYAVSFCAAFEALFLAVGNPDTAAGSELSKALDAAVVAHDGTNADQLAAKITSELESGRQHVAHARGWSPAASMMADLDRVFVAFEAMTAAKRTAANQGPDSVDPQAAFEGAGGVDGWVAMLTAWPTIERPDSVEPCGSLPISP